MTLNAWKIEFKTLQIFFDQTQLTFYWIVCLLSHKSETHPECNRARLTYCQLFLVLPSKANHFLAAVLNKQIKSGINFFNLTLSRRANKASFPKCQEKSRMRVNVNRLILMGLLSGCFTHFGLFQRLLRRDGRHNLYLFLNSGRIVFFQCGLRNQILFPSSQDSLFPVMELVRCRLSVALASGCFEEVRRKNGNRMSDNLLNSVE